MQLRPAQEIILQYSGGRLAVNAVPGSGKTFTLSLLSANLIAQGRINVELGEQVLIVTYLNASVDTFRAGIRQHLADLGLDELGFDVRTLHSLSLEIIRHSESGLTNPELELAVADESLSERILFQAVDGWSGVNPDLMTTFLPNNSPQMRVRWREMTVKLARDIIRTAKNRRYSPHQIRDELSKTDVSEPGGCSQEFQQSDDNISLMSMLVDIYQRYQTTLDRLHTLDFDDIIWQAVDLLESREDLAYVFRERWPYVLEDEAQDSVPLQEKLLNALTGQGGHWVRVGDPNQAITSTFTAADPRHFSSFIRRSDVSSLPLPNSGRSARKIYQLANTLIDWVMNDHPVLEVRQHAFLKQYILAAPSGDSQPNPSDRESTIIFKAYKHREEEELPGVARLATKLTRQKPKLSVAILTPTNALGKAIAGHLDHLGADYDDMLRGSGKVREVSSILRAVVSTLSNPLSKTDLEALYTALCEINHSSIAGVHDSKRISALLRSISRPEMFLFPLEPQDLDSTLPAGIPSGEDVRFLHNFSVFLQRLFKLRPLAVDDLILSLSEVIFASGDEDSSISYELELAVAYQIASEMRLRFDSQPDWRLPELAVELADLANGRRQLQSFNPKESGYKPVPGRITLATQHSAKGMEWDAVFLVGVDEFWIPGDLDAHFQGVNDFIGGDLSAEVNALLLEIMADDHGHYPGRTATESAHIEVICERLRLLYVGITRARKNLYISRSQHIHRFNGDIAVRPATVLAALYDFTEMYAPVS
ncbi:MAG TPA: ATP-dependent helicase [Patescibacteria group bacterium]|nr:ATP-dependent helicase [Patescibacteria group bacterium]